MLVMTMYHCFDQNLFLEIVACGWLIPCYLKLFTLRFGAVRLFNWRIQALAQACAVCSLGTVSMFCTTGLRQGLSAGG